MRFTFEDDCIGYEMVTKSDQGLMVSVSFNEKGVYLVSLDDGDAGEFEDTCDNLVAIAVLIDGEWTTLNQIKDNAIAQFDGLLDEYKQDQADEESHMRELNDRWGE